MHTVLKTDADGAVMLPPELCRTAGIAPESDLIAEVQGGRIVVGPTAPSLAERIVARAHALSSGVLDTLPSDLAAQHDHYLYGSPKKVE